jgi:hypothetical protein
MLQVSCVGVLQGIGLSFKAALNNGPRQAVVTLTANTCGCVALLGRCENKLTRNSEILLTVSHGGEFVSVSAPQDCLDGGSPDRISRDFSQSL